MDLGDGEKEKHVILEDMPDSYNASEQIWVPFLLSDCQVDENTIIIGHSSGAEAAMRLAENHKVLGLVLVCACHTDLGVESETLAGYYNRPWNWDQIKSNVGRFGILQFHSLDDPFICIEEADFVAENLSSQYFRCDNRSHFFTKPDASLILNEIVKKYNDIY